ncbi:T-box protein 12 [Aphelenchoides avenae]|nr:T-box protein 12 [Aphelenchus avenae]
MPTPSPSPSPGLDVHCGHLESESESDLEDSSDSDSDSRRMFPAVKVRFEGCDPDAMYYVLMDVVPVDNHRYRYVCNKSAWQQAGKAEPDPPSLLFVNPDCPYTGKQLTTQTVTFEKAKLTNNDVGDGKVGHLILNSMHKYIPRIHLVRRDKSQTDKLGTAPSGLAGEEYWTFTFKEMEFMAVTAYQNQLVTQQKIARNPFAKGFRDPHGRTDRMSDLPSRTPDPMQSSLHAQGIHLWQQQQLERLRNHGLLASLGGHHMPFGMPLLTSPLAHFLPPPMPPAGFQVDPAALQQLLMSQQYHMFVAAAAMQSGAFPGSSTGGQLPPSGRLSGRDDDEDADGNSSSAFTPVRSASTNSSLIGNSPTEETSVRKAPSRCQIPRLEPGQSPAPRVR